MGSTSRASRPGERCVMLRADAGPSIGYGHVMRCLTLGAELRQRHWKVVLVSAGLDCFLTKRAKALGVAVVTLDEQHGANRDQAITSELGPDVLVLDGYHFGVDYWSALRSGVAVTVRIDDNGANDLRAVDLVVNQNIHASTGMYPGVAEERLLLGPRYALIRNEVTARQTRSRSCKRSRPSVLVAIGGTDVLGLAPQLAEALAADGTVEVHIAGKRSARGASQAPADIAELLSEVAVAVIGGGSTMLEACYLGTPAVVLVVADNQVDGTSAMADMGFAEVFDCRRHVPVDEVVQAVKMLLADVGELAARSARGRALVDGQGAERVADAIEGLVAA